jgi:cytochrome P450
MHFTHHEPQIIDVLGRGFHGDCYREIQNFFLWCYFCQLTWRQYFVTILVYNIYFHPLAGYPGPKQWTSNRFTYVLSIWSGFLARDVRQLHSKYGAFVRIAPDEISIASPDAWHDVYSNTGERDALPKSKLWHSPTPGRPKSILNALEPKDHQRFRRSIEPGLSERALRDQEKVLKSYIGSMITRLEDIVSGNSGAEVVDIVRWFGFTTFDLIGDLGFGESFNCLEGSDFHPWILLIFNSLRAATLNASLRYYPGLNWLLGLAIPKSVMRKQREHWALAADKVNRRLNLEMARPDILSHIKIDDEGISGLTLGEVQATASIIIVAGSETTVSILSGITNYLVKNPIKLAFLTAEIRDRFDSLESMSLSTLKDLEYLNAVIHEGFRLCNPTYVSKQSLFQLVLTVVGPLDFRESSHLAESKLQENTSQLTPLSMFILLPSHFLPCSLHNLNNLSQRDGYPPRPRIESLRSTTTSVERCKFLALGHDLAREDSLLWQSSVSCYLS